MSVFKLGIYYSPYKQLLSTPSSHNSSPFHPPAPKEEDAAACPYWAQPCVHTSLLAQTRCLSSHKSDDYHAPMEAVHQELTWCTPIGNRNLFPRTRLHTNQTSQTLQNADDMGVGFPAPFCSRDQLLLGWATC